MTEGENFNHPPQCNEVREMFRENCILNTEIFLAWSQANVWLLPCNSSLHPVLESAQMALLSWSHIFGLPRKLGVHDWGWWPGQKKCKKEKGNLVVNLDFGFRGYFRALNKEQISTELTLVAVVAMGNGLWSH